MPLPRSNRISQIAEKAKSDYYFLAKEILGYSKLEPVPHRDLCEMVERPGKRKKLILMPRNSFKSSCVTTAYCIRAMVKNPNIRILIASETQKSSIKYLRAVKTHIESNAKLKALFGSWKGEGNWRDTEFTINKRTDLTIKEPTLMASSLEKQSVVGMHFDIIILDDVVSRNTIGTAEAIEKTIDFYKLLLSVLDPGPDKQMIVIGTRWHMDDLYGWLLDETGPEYNGLDVFIREAIDEQGKLLLPKVLTKEFLDEQRKTQGDYNYFCQYHNKPVSSDTATFKPEWVKFYEKAPPGLVYFMSVDPALSLDKSADFTGIVVVGCDWRHNWYVQEAIQKRMEPKETIDLLFHLADKYKPLMCLGMEKFALEKLMKVSLEEAFQKRNQWIPIKEVQTDTRVSKEVRIKALQPRFQNGQIYLKREHEDLYRQIVMHPQVKHDDLIDALKTHLSLTFPGAQVGDSPEKSSEHLSQREKEIWKDVNKYAKRRGVRRTRRIA